MKKRSPTPPRMLPASWTCARCGWVTTNRNDIRWGIEIQDCRRCNPDDPDRPPDDKPRRPGGAGVDPRKQEEEPA